MCGASASPQSWDDDHGGNTDADHGAGNGDEHSAGKNAEHNAAAYNTLDDFRDKEVWVCWRDVTRNGKSTKIPINANSGGDAKSNDPKTWATLDRAKYWAKRNAGCNIGIVLAQVDDLHLGGVDLDTCRDKKTGELKPWAKEAIERLDSYSEISPSMSGVKIFFLYRLSDKAGLDALLGGADKHSRMFKCDTGGDHPPAIEVHRSNRYFTVTRKQYENFEKLRIVSVEDIRWLIEDAGPALKGANVKASSSSGKYQGSGNQGNDNSRSGKAFREGARLKAGGASYEEMRDALLNHADPDVVAWVKEKGEASGERELHRIFDRANTGMGALPEGCAYDHFRAHMPDHTYIHLPTMTGWPAASVNSRLPWLPLLDEHGQPVLDSKGKPKKQKPNVHLDKTRPVELIIWTPDEPILVEDRYLVDGSGWQEHKGGHCLNSYKPPTIKHGDPAQAGPWLDLVRKLYPDDAEHILNYMAFKVQNPGKKINHALFLGGDPGIGKDTMLEPLVHAVGPWNFKEVKPSDLFETFNPFVKAVILRISEAHDLGEVSRYQFYERIKVYTATPPDVIPCNDKHIRKCNVVNCMGTIITSNHKTDGIYLPADDRRHYVAWSNRKPEDFEPGYFDKLWVWYGDGGLGHVAAYLATRDISKFNPKAPPRKTPAFWAIVDASRAPEEGELADVIDLMGNPKALTLSGLIAKTTLNNSLCDWLTDRKNRRNIPHRLKSCGYEQFRNPDANDGYWKIGRDRHAIYVREELTVKERMQAAAELVKKGKPQRSWSKGKRQRSWSKAKPQKSWSRATPNRPSFAGGFASGKPDYDAPPKT
jgi:hypothetical protein